MSKIVVALGGNALGDNLDEQMRAAKIAATAIVDLAEAGHQLALVHGNGPQVGMIESAFETASHADPHFPILPMSVCVALSQGYIGYDLQNVMRRELDARGLDISVATVITQVEVDPEDSAFANPTKPIGGFLNAEQAAHLREQGIPVMEDSGRGWRQVVASPQPIGIIETPTIKTLLAQGQIPIAAGGGGIPVALKNGQYHGQSAVIDKDATASKLAELIDADLLLILTAVEKVCLDFGQASQRELDHMSATEARTWLAQGHFGKGSMEPKVRAAVDFVSTGKGRSALITKLATARAGLEGHTGTHIVA
jgi:carbamate kinase